MSVVITIVCLLISIAVSPPLQDPLQEACFLAIGVFWFFFYLEGAVAVATLLQRFAMTDS